MDTKPKAIPLAAVLAVLAILLMIMGVGCQTIGHRLWTLKTPVGEFSIEDEAFPDSTGTMRYSQTVDDGGRSFLQWLIGGNDDEGEDEAEAGSTTETETGDDGGG